MYNAKLAILVLSLLDLLVCINGPINLLVPRTENSDSDFLSLSLHSCRRDWEIVSLILLGSQST